MDTIRNWLEERCRRKAIQGLIWRLLDPNPLEKQHAEEKLANYDSDSATILIGELERTVRSGRWLPVQVVMGIAIVPVAVFNVFEPFIQDPQYRLTIATASGGLLLSVFMGQLRSLRNCTSKILATLSDARAVSPLAEALERTSSSTRSTLTSALIRLLPSLDSQDEHLLSPAAKLALNRALLGDETMFIDAILKALEKIGDSRFIPNVRSLANGEGRAAFDLRLKDSAVSCLRVSEASAQFETERATLLRATSVTEAPAATLLRSAGPASSLNSGQLLRAGSQQESE
jgi:hypothetical protein